MAYSKNKEIILIGDTGLLSKALKESLIMRNIPFKIIKITRKNNISKKEELYKILKNNLRTRTSYTLINCLASLKPKNKSDVYINENLPKDLLLYPSKGESFLIQFSTNNVLKDQIKDSYSIQKKKAEKNINEIINSKYNLIRLPFLLPKNNFNKNSLPKQLKLLMNFIDLPYISFVPPSRNIYRPINVEEIVDLTISKITANKKNIKNETIIINGPREMNLLDISKLILSKKKNRKKNMFIVIPFPWKILDFFLSKFPCLLNIFERSTILQQLLPIKR